jgi:hypothetical protein
MDQDELIQIDNPHNRSVNQHFEDGLHDDIPEFEVSTSF